MESIGTELMQVYDELTELELVELQIKFSKFNKELKDIFDSKILEIEKNIDSQMEFYGIKSEDYYGEKQNILNKYIQEFQKIYDERKVQFYNIENEIAEIQANQKITLTNFYKTTDNRKKGYLKDENSEEYTESLVKLLQKYNSYDYLIKECDKKLEECLSASKDDFEEITKYRNTNLSVVKKANLISKIINKIIGIFSGSSRFDKKIAKNMEKELVDISNNTNSVIEKINSQTLSIISLIEQARNEINLQCKVNVR